ncbi:hypothetical protein CCAX7_49220 [Capsulimonas corticalis]|uniref:Uncharacterized protein n=1 Tax=Capsulimonas corticalis TaxID=2219043 RepID=A0A402CPZ9_9BACT|nr:hypothetical protein [Capsulimonas corticalis]BDI32871.1 hypothetical protein CCAX7_49220 [Capsulimonas corticalis]
MLCASAFGVRAQSFSDSPDISAQDSIAAPLTAAPAAAVVANSGVITLNGKSSYWLGADYAWYNYSTDFGTGAWGKFTDWSAVSADFGAMHANGVHVVRWWVFGDGRYSPEFSSTGAVTGLDSYVLSDIDHALQIAAANHVAILFTLIDSSIWAAASNSSGLQTGGHAALVTSSTVQKSYLDKALKPLLQHIAAGSYRAEVAGYDLVNEPEAQMSGYWGGSNLSSTSVKAFVKQCATYVHTYGGSGSLATVGSATPYYVSTWKSLGLDFYQIHYYPWMDFSNGAGSGLPTYASQALDKPCIVGEFPTADSSYGLTDTNVQSANWYLNSIETKGYAGAIAWSYRVSDSATKWTSFQPVYTNWNTLHSAITGPVLP